MIIYIEILKIYNNNKNLGYKMKIIQKKKIKYKIIIFFL